LFEAARCGSGTAVRCLVERLGASPTAVNSHGDTAVDIASGEGDMDVLRMLVDTFGASRAAEDWVCHRAMSMHSVMWGVPCCGVLTRPPSGGVPSVCVSVCGCVCGCLCVCVCVTPRTATTRCTGRARSAARTSSGTSSRSTAQTWGIATRCVHHCRHEYHHRPHCLHPSTWPRVTVVPLCAIRTA
jgi:hypothetical protein